MPAFRRAYDAARSVDGLMRLLEKRGVPNAARGRQVSGPGRAKSSEIKGLKTKCQLCVSCTRVISRPRSPSSLLSCILMRRLRSESFSSPAIHADVGDATRQQFRHRVDHFIGAARIDHLHVDVSLQRVARRRRNVDGNHVAEQADLVDHFFDEGQHHVQPRSDRSHMPADSAQRVDLAFRNAPARRRKAVRQSRR